jgi:uncharacterized repeat protein (TIGR03843 family)
MDTAVYLALLELGSIEIEGLLPWSSNYSFLVQISPNTAVAEAFPDIANIPTIRAVYKPKRGERPLWDFPQGTLYQREYAAFLVSHTLDWHLVPPTVIRTGPHGIGSIQLFIPHNPDCHYFTIEGQANFRSQLQKIALFDILINNADRKAGHVLIEETDSEEDPSQLWLIDHGIAFHHENKLRTVIWEFAGQPIPEPLQQQLQQFSDTLATNQNALRTQFSQLLHTRELQALQQRNQNLWQNGRYITPGPGRHYPWPPI